MIQLSFDDLLVVKRNQKGVLYAEIWDKQIVVAKQCTTCKKWKFLDDFNKAGKGFAGKHSLCRDCHNGRNEYILAKRVIAEGTIIDDGLNDSVSLTAYFQPQPKQEPPINVRRYTPEEEALERIKEEQERANAEATRRMWF